MKLYKIIDSNNRSMNGGFFNWTKYLPIGSKKGKWTPRIKDINECSKGYHVTEYWNMWINNITDQVYECEVKGLKKNNDIGVIEKYVCESIRLIKKLDLKFDNNSNTGNSNTGNWNTGDSNTGNWNTGNRNTGDSNTGNSNTGNSNTGNSNTGYSNTGNRNTGNRNTGDSNTGNSNTGNSNTGYSNTGNWNTGNRNTGDSNTGNSNTGYSNTGYSNTGNSNTGNWNTGNSNTGAFNTKEPEYYELFNLPISKDMYENINFPNYFYFSLIKNKSYKESWEQSFKNASIKEIEDTIILPNFSYTIFKEITGITKKMILNKIKKGR